jgi:hypothetical protein
MTDPRTGAKYPKGDHRITVADAAAMTAAFRARSPGGVHGWMFDRSAFDALLAQPGCMGIRIYRGMRGDGAEQVVMVGTDSSGNDMVPASVDQPGEVMEVSWPCPPVCGTRSVLNGRS